MQSKKQNNRQETYTLSKIGFVRLYILASCLGIVSLIFMLFGTNGAERTQDKIMIGIMILITCACLYAAYLYSRWYIKFENGSLEYRTVFGKVKTYSWQEIVELNRERNEGIVAVFADGTVLKFVQTEERVYMEQFCEMNDLTIEPYGTKEFFEVSFHPLIRFCCGFTFFVGIGFWLLSLPFEIYGFVTGLIFLLFFAFFVYAELFYKLVIKHRSLCEKRFLSREKRIPYSEVHKCSVEKRFKGQFMCFHTSKGIEISVPVGIGNYELLKQVAEDEGWLIRE